MGRLNYQEHCRPNTRRIQKFDASFNLLFVFTSYTIPKSGKYFKSKSSTYSLFILFIYYLFSFWLFGTFRNKLDGGKHMLANYEMVELQPKENKQRTREYAQPMENPRRGTNFQNFCFRDRSSCCAHRRFGK
jgi:hypothetical protein